MLKKSLGLLTALLIAASNAALMPANAFTRETSGDKRESASIGVLPVVGNIMGSDKTAAESAALNSILGAAGMGNDYFDELDIDTSDYPSSFDLRETGAVSSVKNQGNYGTCWSFGSTASIESSLLPRNPWVDLSEWQVAYFTFAGENALEVYDEYAGIYNQGGWTISYVNTLAQWIGPVSEAEIPYDSGDPDESQRYLADYNLREALCLNNFYDNAYTYPEKNEIKYLMYSSQSAVAISYFSAQEYFNFDTNSHCCLDRNYANHLIAIVGWDDSYSRFNFNSDNRPRKNGAWLCKNSWGAEEFGDNGYFWISYEDTSISEASVLSVDDADKYDNLYAYDTLMWGASIAADPLESETSYMANIFTANGDEDVTAAAFYTTDNNAQYEITVYTGITDGMDPTSGTASAVTSGTIEIAGYHTVDLDAIVPVNAGELYSVVVKLTNPSIPYPIPVEAAFVYISALQDGSLDLESYFVTYEKILNNTEEGQSFISLDGSDWQDTCLMYYDLTPEIDYAQAQENLGKAKAAFAESPSKDIFDIIAENPTEEVYTILGNVCLKAITNNRQKVNFSLPSGGILSGETVALSSADCDAIYYTLDGSEPSAENGILYSEPVSLPEGGCINAVAVKDGVQGEVATACYTANIAMLSSLVIEDGKSLFNIGFDELAGGIYTESPLYSDFYSDTIEFSPIAAYPITINGKPVISGHSVTMPVAFGENTFVITVSDENEGTTEYTISVYRQDIKFDTLTGLLVFDTNTYTATAPDASQVESGFDFTGFTGEDFTFYNLNTGEASVVTAPGKALFDLEEALIDYPNSMLVNFITADILLNTTDEPLMLVAYDEEMTDAMDVMWLASLTPDFDINLLISFLMEWAFGNADQEMIDEFMEYAKYRIGIYVAPGETLYFQIPATEFALASDVVAFNVPDAPMLDEEMLIISSVTDNSISAEAVEGCEYAIVEADSYFDDGDDGYEDSVYYNNASEIFRSALRGSYESVMLYEGYDTEYEWQDSPEFTELDPGTDYIVMMRMKATETTFASHILTVNQMTAGSAPLVKINFKNETLIFDIENCTVSSASGTKIAPGSIISGYIGKTLTVTPVNGEPYAFEIPARPEAPEVGINYAECISTVVIPDNMWISLTEGEFWNDTESITTKIDYPASTFTNAEGYLDFQVINGITVEFYTIAERKSFASERFSLQIPFITETPEFYGEIERLTTNSVEFFCYDVNTVYALADIETGETGQWQSSPEFTGLEAGTDYLFAIKSEFTDYSFATIPIYTMITTRTQDFACYAYSVSECYEILSYFDDVLATAEDTVCISVECDEETLAAASDEEGYIDVSYFGLDPELTYAYIDENGALVFSVSAFWYEAIGRVILTLRDYGFGTVYVFDVFAPEDGILYDFPRYQAGDVNLDGSVSIKDLSLLVKHIVGTITLEGDALNAADCNADGKVTIIDLSRLVKYIAGFDVILGA